MGNLKKRIKVRGPLKGYCTICGEFGELTADHVPPKGCANISPVEIRTLTKALNKTSEKPRYSQNGVKFRTICSVCNNDRLGGEYDKEIINLANEITQYYRPILDSGLSLPSIQKITIKPQRLARAIIGHLLAAEPVKNVKAKPVDAPFPNKLREYFLDQSQDLPEGIEIYYWLYPSKTHVIIKGCGLAILGAGCSAVGHIMKFFPLVFYVVHNRPEKMVIPHNMLVIEKTTEIDQLAEIEINYNNVPPIGWPENPTGNEILLLTEEQTHHAILRNKHRKRI